MPCFQTESQSICSVLRWKTGGAQVRCPSSRLSEPAGPRPRGPAHLQPLRGVIALGGPSVDLALLVQPRIVGIPAEGAQAPGPVDAGCHDLLVGDGVVLQAQWFSTSCQEGGYHLDLGSTASRGCVQKVMKGRPPGILLSPWHPLRQQQKAPSAFWSQPFYLLPARPAHASLPAALSSTSALTCPSQMTYHFSPFAPGQGLIHHLPPSFKACCVRHRLQEDCPDHLPSAEHVPPLDTQHLLCHPAGTAAVHTTSPGITVD